MTALRMIVFAWCLLSLALGAIYNYDVPAFIVLPVALLIMVWLAWSSWRAVQNNEGVMLMRSGRVVSALEKFQSADAYGRSAVYALNTGIAELYLLRFDRAKVAFARAASRGIPTHLRPMYEANNALCDAMLEAAPAPPNGKLLAREDPDALLARAANLARRGAWEAAEQLLLRRELQQLGGFTRALTEAIAALSAWRLRGERRRVDRSMLFGEASDEDLARAWPELANFLRDEDGAPR
jgi:hypothetical protein